MWKNKLADMRTDVMCSLTHSPQSNPKEICMKGIGKFCRNYCHRHKRNG